MRAVNLLPKDLQARKSIRYEDPAVVVGSALAVVVMIALGSSFYVAHGKESSAQKRLNGDRIELAQLSLKQRPQPKPVKPAQPITPIVPPPSITGQEATWLSAVTTNIEQRIAWDRLLREVSLVMPDDVTLNSMTMTAPVAAATPGVPTTPPAGGATQGFTIAGTAFSYDSVARLLSRLALVPDLSDVTLTSTGAGGSSGGSSGSSSSSSSSSVTFNITAAVKGAPAPAAPATTTAPPVDTSSTTTGASA
jgi:Fimbrial assembly protein (PilN)